MLSFGDIPILLRGPSNRHTLSLKPIFHCNAELFALCPRVGLETLVSKNAKICVTPNANPERKSVEYWWIWGMHWSCTFHVVCVNFSCVGYPTQTSFQWNIGLRIDYCDQRPFWERSHISGVNCMIWTHFISLDASECSPSYHMTKIIMRQ